MSSYEHSMSGGLGCFLGGCVSWIVMFPCEYGLLCYQLCYTYCRVYHSCPIADFTAARKLHVESLVTAFH